MKRIINSSADTAKPFIIILFILASFTVDAQIPKGGGRCQATADQVYFVASGQMVMDVYPGGNGYQLNIIGAGADNFEVVQEAHMATVYVIPDYTNATQAKWQINFAQGMERVICSIKMKNKCTGQILTYPLTVGVRLFKQ